MGGDNTGYYRFISLLVLFFFITPVLMSQTLSKRNPLPPGIGLAEDAAVAWLKARILPNQEIPNPTSLRRRMVQSYIVSPDNPAYEWLYHRSYTYDNALAAIALTMTGDYRHAESILSALHRNMRSDGSLWFVHNTTNDWPGGEDHEGAMVRSGALAWAGYAAVFYLQERVRRNPRFMEDHSRAGNLLEMAVRIGDYLLDRQVSDPEDGRNGLVTGGWGDYRLSVSGNEIRKKSYPENITWVSTEHNIDIYFLFRDLGILTGDEKWTRGSLRIRRGLMNLWSESDGQFYRGFQLETGLDRSLPLDGASWGSIFLHATGEDAKKIRCLEEMEPRFYHEGENFSGYRPYGDEPVHEDRSVNARYYPEAPGTLWSDIDIVWGEGSLGAAAAYIRAGMDDKAVKIFEDMLDLSQDGGILYASREIPHQFSTDPSAASTAWFVIAIEMLRKTEASAAFWGRYSR